MADQDNLVGDSLHAMIEDESTGSLLHSPGSRGQRSGSWHYPVHTRASLLKPDEKAIKDDFFSSLISPIKPQRRSFAPAYQTQKEIDTIKTDYPLIRKMDYLDMLNKAKRAISEWEADHKTYKNENQVPNTIKAGRQRNNGPYLDTNNSHDHDIPTLVPKGVTHDVGAGIMHNINRNENLRRVRHKRFYNMRLKHRSNEMRRKEERERKAASKDEERRYRNHIKKKLGRNILQVRKLLRRSKKGCVFKIASV